MSNRSTHGPVTDATAAHRVAVMVERARKAQRVAEDHDQERVDEIVAAVAWAIMEPARNRELAELAVRDTGIGRVDDKIAKNHRKTLGLLRDLKGAKSVGVIAEDPARGLVIAMNSASPEAALTPASIAARIALFNAVRAAVDEGPRTGVKSR